MNRKKLSVLVLLFVSITFSEALQPIKLVEQPTAGSYNKGQFGLGINFFGGGGLAYSFGLGITNRFSFGVAHSLMNAIGSGGVRVQNIPGVLVKYRLMEESYYMPGLAIGFESQGSGNYYKSTDSLYYPRFDFKSKGFFGAVSKSYLFLGQPLGFHFLVNYSTIDNQAESERIKPDGQHQNAFVNFSVGMDKSINEELSVLAEYDLALDDDNSRSLIQGYLNAAVRWSIFPSFTVELALKDLIGNKEMPYSPEGVVREVRIYYTDKF